MTRLFTAASLLATAVAAPSYLPKSTNLYDFIIVGGGTSGLVVANRLSEDPRTSVAVIESGDSVFDNVNVTSPSGYSLAFGTDIDWAYQSAPQAYAGNGTQTLRAGKALGGTSTINGMVYMRAETSQLDAWSKIGNHLTWDSLLPYYKKSERFQVPTAEQVQLGAAYTADVHGFNGSLAVGWFDEMVGNNFSTMLNATYKAMNLPWNGEHNAGYMRGYTVYPKSADQALDVREDAARAYYYPISLRPNLDIYLNSTVDRLTWEDSSRSPQPFANGVVYRTSNGTQKVLSAKKEVILSAGALVSPLILERSGVGNPSVLEKYGIETKVDLPTVGENLQDQTTQDTSYTATQNFTGAGGFIGYFNVEDVFGRNESARLSAWIKSSIPTWAEQSSSGGIVNKSTIETLFNIQHKLIFEDLVVISEILVNAPTGGSSLVEYWGLMPFSRGSIHITSANASSPAHINPNYFQLPWDIKQQVKSARLVSPDRTPILHL